jgi:hypothetical protein
VGRRKKKCAKNAVAIHLVSSVSSYILYMIAVNVDSVPKFDDIVFDLSFWCIELNSHIIMFE